ncbi:MAG TPA: glycerol-3-phosphate dehydrogenase/oxidase, partial [Longimicrobiaceae bacterium]
MSPVRDPAGFSAAARAARWEALGREPLDLLVVGGGITGTGIALDAAGRGLRTALVEAGDFAEGTSSRSSRLVHGGLRYLQTGDFRLVFEALSERRRLLRLAPHLVRPLPFLFPLFRGGPVGFRKLQAGMWAYDALSLFRGVRRHRMLRPAAVAEAEPGLRAEGLAGAALYHDASVDDARLTLAVARTAAEAGAELVTHAEVTGFLREGDGIGGARVRDRLGGGTREVRARVVVNATGPWCDALRRLADPGVRPRLRPTKGVHVVLRRERVGNAGAIIFPSPLDGRIMFVLPWGAFTYLGTTDTDYDGSPAAASAEGADVEYLLESVNALYPGARLAAADVLSTWTGVRPLLAPRAEGGGITESATPREHEIWRDRSGLVSVAGGKLTTYRVMAAQAVDFVARVLGRERELASFRAFTEELSLAGAPADPWDAFLERIRAEAVRLGLGEATGTHL